jgi:hypothetical protein
MNNLYTHQPLILILSIDFQDLFNCFGGCDVGNSEFPRYHVIDWVKVYKKENSAITLITEDDEICVDESTTIYAPIYGAGAIYEASVYPSNALEIVEETGFVSLRASEHPGFQGSWHSYKVRGLSPGYHNFNLKITFPSGYIENKSISINVISEPPPPQNWIYYELDELQCCYKFYTNLNNHATSFLWTLTNSLGVVTTESTNNFLDLCFPSGEYTVSVRGKNDCGTSEPYSQHFQLSPRPLIDCEHGSAIISVYPSLSTNFVIITLKDKFDNIVSNDLSGEIIVAEAMGNTICKLNINQNPFFLNTSNYNAGVYMVIWRNHHNLIYSSFIIER